MNETTREPAGRPAPSAPRSLSVPAPFRALQEEMDRVFHAFSMPQMSWPAGGAGALGLRVDIGETDGEIRVRADLPGLSEDEVEVTLEDDMLRIRAEKKEETEREGETWRVAERSRGSFERAIRVPPGIDPEKVAASMEKGVLTVTLPKPPGAQASGKRIPVERAG